MFFCRCTQFPRVVIELDQDSMELTDECRRDILRISDLAGRDKFFRNYGMLFSPLPTIIAEPPLSMSQNKSIKETETNRAASTKAPSLLRSSPSEATFTAPAT